MSETQNNEQQSADFAQFNQAVADTVGRTFELNCALVMGGKQGLAVALGNGLAAIDLLAATVVSGGNDKEVLIKFVESMLSDMRRRADSAFDYFQAKESANEQQ